MDPDRERCDFTRKRNEVDGHLPRGRKLPDLLRQMIFGVVVMVRNRGRRMMPALISMPFVGGRVMLFVVGSFVMVSFVIVSFVIVSFVIVMMIRAVVVTLIHLLVMMTCDVDTDNSHVDMVPARPLVVLGDKVVPACSLVNRQQEREQQRQHDA